MKKPKLFFYLTDKLILPVIATVLAFFITTIASKMKTGDWNSLFSQVPKTAYIITISVFILWVFLILVRKRIRTLRGRDAGPGICYLSRPLHGWVNIMELSYVDVIWQIQTHGQSPILGFDLRKVNPSTIEANTPPRCPKCKTELEEESSFWGGYVWRCVQCGYKKRNRKNFYTESDRATRIAKREWEKHLEELRT